MDRKINRQENESCTWFRHFEYYDLFPYSIAIVMIIGEAYIVRAFIEIANNLNK